MASHSLEVADSVTDGIHSHVAHVQSPRWVWKHGEDIKLLPVGTLQKHSQMIHAQSCEEKNNLILILRDDNNSLHYQPGLYKRLHCINLMRSGQE